MIIKGIIFNKNGRRLHRIILGAITVACICILYCFFILAKKTDMNMVQDLVSDEKPQNIFEYTSYYSEYKVTVRSNKTVNNYTMKEWVMPDKYKLSIKNSENEEIEFIGNNNKFIIKNNGQKNQLLLDEYIIKKENYLSLSTFILLFNEQNEENNFEILENNDEIKYKVEKIVEEKKINLEVIVNAKDGIPKQYLIYNNDELKAEIVFEQFQLNILIDEKLFAF